MNLPKVTIGIVSFNDKPYLELNLKQLLDLNYPDFEILIFDNNANGDIKHWLETTYENIKIFRQGTNLGYGVSHNFLIDKAGGELYLGFNSDIIPDKDFLMELVKIMSTDEKIGCVTGKLLQWGNFPDNPTNLKEQWIDSTGLNILKSHRVFDRGQNEKDQGQYGKVEEIWGASGAAALFRIKALHDVKHIHGEYFDKDFFLYKEDIDLSYRLRWAGWEIVYTPNAITWHDRTTSAMGNMIQTIKKRRDRSRIVKEKSFLNQLLFVYKNWSNEYSWEVKLKTIFFHLQYILYLLFFEQSLLKQCAIFHTMKARMRQKRQTMPRRITSREMEQWFT